MFKAVMDVLNGKAEVVSIAVAPMLRIRELEIYHNTGVFMAGKEVHLNHGEYTMPAWPTDLGRSQKRSSMRPWGEEYLHGTNSGEYHLAAAEAGGGTQASCIHQDGGGDGL
ncbi:MAG: hypothetical protein ACLUIR_10085 [Faecalibacterium prausnitzii]